MSTSTTATSTLRTRLFDTRSSKHNPLPQHISLLTQHPSGLSYTTFTYTTSTLASKNTTALSSTYLTGHLALGGTSDLFDEVASITASVKNTGTVEGAEVAQLYVSYPAEAQQPPRQLRGFEKVKLQPGEEREVTFSVRRRDVSFWDIVAQKWAVAKGV